MDKLPKKERYVVSLSDIYLDGVNREIIKEDVEEFVNGENIYTKTSTRELNTYICSNNVFEKDGTYQTISHEIDKEEYEKNLAETNDKPMKEVRYNFVDQGEQYKLILYLMDNSIFALLERDVINEDKKELPSFIKKAINITTNEIIGYDNGKTL